MHHISKHEMYICLHAYINGYLHASRNYSYFIYNINCKFH
uniref:Uncharacterized protein n=1 Tax=Rhizophora mucronata TaxID=61149 RepID=A0A2P2PGC3_RHIMU